MDEKQNQTPIDLGIYRRQEAAPKVSSVEMAAVAVSILWMAGVGAFFLLTANSERPLDSLRFVMTLMAIFLPVALIWVAVTAARASQVMRDESARLQAAIDAMRQSYVQALQSSQGVKPSVERKLDEIAAAQRKTAHTIATFTSIRPEVEPSAVSAPAIAETPDPEEQGKLELGTSVEEMTAAPVNVSDFVKALNFPENAEDRDGFRALRRALQDRQTAELVRYSQDVLTMLSQDGIYMDDLRPDRARPEIWRKFAQGERGRAIAGLGGVRDRSCLALTAARMREDPVFRDATHHFLRRFDKTFAAFEAGATDADVAALSDTRTARAFMLLGRVTGTFT
ncbi:hypothetical protein AIOL_003278 [Candidatus Rhodobacter oscarellae]|uniref:Uncharacterized protein n=1 Tax=Candidatus Rhodobacter oscarellae TaxID=1675527 RepID=A0A0J9E6M4_9RHOB|nr:hypothetical protein [Candidatus Rhodobacter lobularis]KMW58306.1 hypothetical protein AIOL_003278 [Candidatus Rhodobacter lobularis]